MGYVCLYLIFLKEKKLQLIMKASGVAFFQVIPNVSLSMFCTIKPMIFMHGTEGVRETAGTYVCVLSSQDWITENCCLLPTVE